MRLALTPHPDFPLATVSQLTCEVAVLREGLTLRYRLAGNIADLAIPPPAIPTRTDDLWKHTCFEVFLRPPGEAYVELNFAPSTQWAAYRFDRYREGMAPADAQPTIATTATPTELRLDASVDLAPLRLSPGPCRLALSAVIEDKAGAKSYWALAHPAGRPDFHHEAGFASLLPDPEPA